ncbi:MAG TPA: hypothetical protein VK203_24880 [Nostocaceae cyanobacterium]|nr:hypothetical protein [Nostocaceae cyanobacterium]
MSRVEDYIPTSDREKISKSNHKILMQSEKSWFIKNWVASAKKTK